MLSTTFKKITLKTLGILLCVGVFLKCNSSNDNTISSANIEIKLDENPTHNLDTLNLEKDTLFHSNGMVSFFGILSDTVKHGYCKFFYDNGNLQSQGIYNNGIKESWWEYYSESGKIISEGKYLKGKKTDHWNQYNENGSKKAVIFYLNHQKNDWCFFYNTEGVLEEECEYLLDKKHGFCNLYIDGILFQSGSYHNGKKTGIWKTFNEKGKIINEKEF